MAIASEDLATELLRFSGGAKGVVTVGQVCAGHRNDCWLEVDGPSGSLRWAWHQEGWADAFFHVMRDIYAVIADPDPTAQAGCSGG